MESEVASDNVWEVGYHAANVWEPDYHGNAGVVWEDYNSPDYRQLDMKSELAFSNIGNGEEYSNERWSEAREYASIVFPITAGAW